MRVEARAHPRPSYGLGLVGSFAMLAFAAAAVAVEPVSDYGAGADLVLWPFASVAPDRAKGTDTERSRPWSSTHASGWSHRSLLAGPVGPSSKNGSVHIA